MADLSSLTIPYEEEEEEEEEDEMYDDIDGLDSQNSGSQHRPIMLPGSLGLKQPSEEKEEDDIYEVLPGEELHLLVVFLEFQKLLIWWKNATAGTPEQARSLKESM